MSEQNPSQFQFPQVCVVEASAGSGKTRALAIRFIGLLMNPALKPAEIPLKNILAITFSNKATVEMKTRILEFLKKIALDRFSDEAEKKSILASLGVEYAFAQKKAFAIMDYLIRNYNFFQVQTIDSFINAILSACAFKLDRSAGFRIKTDSSDYLTYGLDKLIDRAAQDQKIIATFHNFLMRYLSLENRTGWFPRKDILSVIASLFGEYNKYARPFASCETEPAQLLAMKKKILNLMNELKKRLPGGTHANFEKNFLLFLEKNSETFDFEDLSSYFRRDEYPVRKDETLPDEIEKLWGRIRKDLREAAELESHAVFNEYVDIFLSVFDQFKELSKKDDILFLDELNRETRLLFDEGSMTVPELYFRLASRFSHFLIDEFQDTSLLQWENLFPMVEEALSGRGSLFYVGDKKQAIYRFRGGEVSLFDGVKERFGALTPVSVTLSRNYRSQKHIVEFCNRIFSQENLRGFLEQNSREKKSAREFSDRQINEIVDVFAGAQQTHLEGREAGFVKVEYLDSKNKEEQDEALRSRLIDLVESLKNKFDYREIAVLTRENDDVELLTAWLLEKGIPVESEKTLNIRNNECIKELVSFLKFLNSPIDNLSFASFILGDIFSKASGVSTDEIRDFIFEVRGKKQKEKNIYLYREFRARFPQLWEAFFEDFFKNVGFLPLYELTISILAKFDCLVHFAVFQGFFMKFLELVKKEEEDHQSLSLFLEYFDQARDEDLYVRVSETDSVKVLTIHKSKGLGFGAVIIPFLEMNVRVDADVTYESSENHLVRVRLSEKYRNFSGLLDGIWRREYQKAFVDELNNIYVAFTRAIDELYIFIPGKAAKGNNLARALVTVENSEYGCRKVHEGKRNRKEKSPALEIPLSRYKDWIPILKNEFIEEGVLKNRKQRLKGEILHMIFSQIGNLNCEDPRKAIDLAVEKTAQRYPLIEDFSEFREIAGKVLADERLRPFFFVEEGDVFQEKEVVNADGHTKRIDRLIVKKNEIWIIDYKSFSEEAIGDRAQIVEYMAIVKDIYHSRKVKGVLIYLDRLKTEEIYGTD